MLRYDRQTKPGLVALYDIWPGNGAGPFLQPRSPHGAGSGGDNWTTGALSRANLQSNHHNQQTNIQYFRGPSCRPTNSVKALKENNIIQHNKK